MTLHHHIPLCLLKQSEFTPISLYIKGGYEFDQYQSNAFDQLGWKMNGSGIIFGGTLGHSFKSSPTVNLIPNLGFYYANGTSKIIDSYGNTITSTNEITSLFIGVSFSFLLTDSNIFVFDPGVSISEGNTNFTISLGLLFPTGLNTISRSDNDLNSIFTDSKNSYLDIIKIQGIYLLIKLPDENYQIGQIFNIIRQSNNSIKKVGTAQIMKIQNNRAALKYNIFDNNVRITIQDKIEI